MAKKYVSQIDKQNEPYHIYRQGTSIGTNETGYTLFLNTPNREYNILDEEAYNYRPTGGSLNVGDSEKDTIVGGTLAWNQLVPNGNFSDGTTGWIPTYGTSVVANNILTYTVSRVGSGSQNRISRENNIDITQGHKYLIFFNVKTPYAQDVGFLAYSASITNITINNVQKTSVAGTWYNFYSIVNAVRSGPSNFRFYTASVNDTAIGDEYNYQNINVIDLTQTLGTTIADHIYNLELTTTGAGIAYFKKYFPKIYYQHSLPTLQNVCVSKHIMTEENQWDEEWELGSINRNTGANETAISGIRSKNYIHVVSGNIYYFKAPMPCELYIYDADKNYIGLGAIQLYNNTYTIHNDIAYIRFSTAYGYGTTYNHDICINISYPSFNGTYKPYKKYEYNINPNKVQLRGIYKLNTNNNLYCYGDIWYGDSRIERKFGVVDLGDLNWTYLEARQVFYAPVPGCAGWDTRSPAGDTVCTQYIPEQYTAVVTTTHTKDRVYMIADTTKNIYLYDSAAIGKTAVQFKEYVTGIPVVYELLTPYIEIQNRYENTQTCNNAGTEQYIDALVEDGTRDVKIPVGHLTTYDEPKEDLQKLS